MDKRGLCLEIVNEGFVRVALALGDISSGNKIPDDAVWKLAEAIDHSCGMVMKKLLEVRVTSGLDDVPDDAYGPPAVSQLLKRLEERKRWCGGNKEDDIGLD